MTSCKLNQIFLGEVAATQSYGAFIRIPGTPQQGLIHKSQVSSAHVDDVADVLQKGDRVWCKVISVGDDGKIGLSMKYVNQGNGADLDPNGVEQQRDAQKKRAMGRPEKKAIQLEAILNTTCTKCGTPGHLSKDCFMSPDGKKYELLPDIEEEQTVVQPPIEVDTLEKDKEKLHKEKKLKKKKKSKKHKENSGDSDESNSKSKKLKKKKNKYSKDQKKKKKKKKHESSSNDKSSSSSSSHDIKAHKRKSTDSEDRYPKKHKSSKH